MQWISNMWCINFLAIDQKPVPKPTPSRPAKKPTPPKTKKEKTPEQREAEEVFHSKPTMVKRSREREHKDSLDFTDGQY